MWPKQSNSTFFKYLKLLPVLLAMLSATAYTAANAQSDNNEKQNNENSLRWDEPELRFVTDSDYPPFNYVDEDGALTGFNVDLARAICLEMEVRCDIQAKSWNELIPVVNNGGADAIIASLAISKNTVSQVDFTDRYFKMNARFVMRSGTKVKKPTPEKLSRYTVGVLAKTSHEAYLKDFFIYSTVKSFKTPDEMYRALTDKEVDLIFGDTIALMFWLNGTSSEGCCRFIGKAFTEEKYFGEGVAMAVAKNNKKLRLVLNNALKKVHESGRYEELILRYFPLRF